VFLFVHAVRTVPAALPELGRFGNDVVVLRDDDGSQTMRRYLPYLLVDVDETTIARDSDIGHRTWCAGSTNL
jgi:hypothetical protein